MRSRPWLALLTLLTVWLLACRPPSAELVLTPEAGEPEGAEPSGIGGQQVFVEAPTIPEPGPILDWANVDGDLGELIEGERYRIDYDVDHPWTGSSSPLVTAVVFYDYQCPYSKRLSETLAALLGRYGDELRIVWRQLPLPMHRDAELAARFALAAHAQGGFAAMHEWMFANARTLSRQNLEGQAFEFGLDPGRLASDVDGGWIAERVTLDKDFAAAQGVNATPTMFINGRPVRGALPQDAIAAIIDEELTTAEHLLAAGSERREIWARFMVASDPGPLGSNRPSPPSSSGPDPDKRYAMQVGSLSRRGPAKAKVELLMCGDFDCPYCKRSTAVLEDLRKRHKKDLAIFFRHMPLPMHKDAMAAHRAAVAADNQGAFWAMFELLYADQDKRDAAELEDLAKQAKLDLKQFRRDIADPKTDELINQQREFCEKQLDVRGTPTFFINGRPLTGAQPIDAFETIITEELAAKP